MSYRRLTIADFPKICWMPDRVATDPHKMFVRVRLTTFEQWNFLDIEDEPAHIGRGSLVFPTGTLFLAGERELP